MKKYIFLSMILGLSISSFAQTKEGLKQDQIKNASTINTSIADSQTFAKSLQIKPYKFNHTILDGPRIYVIDGKISQHGFAEIEPKDIKSLTLLNNERARSLYGEGSGGVILITTKRGANETKCRK